MQEHPLNYSALHFLAQIDETTRLFWVPPPFTGASLQEVSWGNCRAHFVCFLLSYFYTTFSAMPENYFFIYYAWFSSCFRQKGKSHPYYSMPGRRSPTNINLDTRITTFHAVMYHKLLNYYLTVVYLGYFHFSTHKDTINTFIHKV